MNRNQSQIGQSSLVLVRLFGLAIVILAFLVSVMAAAPTLNINLADGGVSLSFVGGVTPSHGYELQGSEDLVTWIHLKNIPAEPGQVVSITAPKLASQKNGFFRLVEGVSSDPSVDVSLDIASPLDRAVLISPDAETPNILLGIFNFKMLNGNGMLRGLDLELQVLKENVWVPGVFGEIKLRIGSLGYYQVANRQLEIKTPVGYSAGAVSWSVINTPLLEGMNVPVAIYADMLPSVDNSWDGLQVRVVLRSKGFSGGDKNSPSVTGPYDNDSLDVSETATYGPIVTLVRSDIRVDSASTKIGAAVFGNGQIIGYSVSFLFRVTSGDQDMYLNSDPSQAIPVEVQNGIFNYGNLVSVPGSLAGDTASTARAPTFARSASSSVRC